jgi:cytochrome subunit of sulfide dehydrogenase
MRGNVLKAILVAGLLASGPVLAAPPSAAMLSFSCATCHGYDGVSVGPASPSIAGMPTEYFINTMQDFRDGKRPATVMDRIAKGYTDEEIELMAEFFADKKYAPAKQAFDPAKAARGAQIHEKSCERCHTEGGTFLEEDTALLAGQWLPYLQFSLVDFTSGARHMPDTMSQRIGRLSADELDALLHFYASQQDLKAYEH